MKALFWEGIDRIAVRESPPPEPGNGEALVRVTHTGICGSDLTIVSGKHPRARTPLILGHEFSGTIESLPADAPDRLSRGQRVVVEPLLSCGECRPCRSGHEHVCERLKLLGVETDGGFAEYVKVPVERLYPIPDTVSNRDAALIEPLAVAVHAVSYGALRQDDSVVVVGAGPIGLLIARVARAHGVANITICEINRFRIGLARNNGFDVIDTGSEDLVEEVLARTDGRGADVTFDAAGVPAVCGSLISMTGIMGRIILVAIYKKPCEVFFQQLSYREQTIRGTRIYAKGDFARALELLGNKVVDVASLVTGEYPMTDALAAFRAAADPDRHCKVVIIQE